MRYYLMLIRMAIIKKTRDNKCLHKMWGKGNTCALLVRLQISTATVKKCTEVYLKIKNKPTI